MPSFVWKRDPEEAFRNPYEYDAQNQFFREAKGVLEELRIILDRNAMKFHRDDQSLKKAVWLLHTDAMCALLDAVEALEAKKHRPAIRVCRDVRETIDIAKYFSAKTQESTADLARWYQNEVVLHKKYRTHVEKTRGRATAQQELEYHRSLSKFVHRTYRAIAASCGVGRGDLLWHDSHSRTLPMLPHPVSAYCPIVASFILELCSEIAARGLTTKREIDDVLNANREKESVPRRFVPI
ncbi:MAG: hypothetical protein WC081_00325 [Candidatus Ratteibacteria bacterium]